MKEKDNTPSYGHPSSVKRGICRSAFPFTCEGVPHSGGVVSSRVKGCRIAAG